MCVKWEKVEMILYEVRKIVSLIMPEQNLQKMAELPKRKINSVKNYNKNREDHLNEDQDVLRPQPGYNLFTFSF